MRLLLICDAGDGLLDLALRAQETGHIVRVFVRKFDPRTRPVGKGLVELVPDWRPHMDWADLVVLEGNGFSMIEFGRWRQRGVPIIGGDQESASWELDREVGMKVLQRAGVPVPPWRLFTDYDSAIRYVERRGEPLYSKPSSDTADKSLSAKTGIPEDPTWQLRRWKKKHGRPPCSFLLQDPIENGIEFGCAAWFGPAGFVDGIEQNWEGKKLFAGDLGQNTGEMYSVLRYVRRCKLFEKVLLPCEEQLAASGYVGSASVNCMIDEEGNPWPLEWTQRLGWPAFNLETDLFNCDPVEFLHALAYGETFRGAHRMNEVALGLVLAIPPYPHAPRDYEAEILDIPIYGQDVYFHPCEVQRAEPEAGTEFATAGHYVGVVIGTGNTVREAARSAYRSIGKISMPCSPFWRVDAGIRLRKQLPQLNEHGYCLGLEY
jgi:phosphoribosylamine--glycine ligase